MSGGEAVPGDPKRAELGARVASGVGWKAMSGFVGQATRVAVVAVLTRLLTPHDFGVAGMVLVILPFIVNFSDCGLGIALVQRSAITELEISTVFWASIAIGGALSVAGVAVSPLAARFYHDDNVAPLFAMLSLGFFLTSLASTQRSLLMRAMNFRVLELRLVAGTVVGAVVGISVAAIGGGPWALVWMQLSSTITSTLLLWGMSRWRPSFAFSFRVVRELGVFGARYLGATTFQTLNRNADNVLVGRFAGSHALGLYMLAYSVILAPLSRLAHPVMQILTPALARVQDDDDALQRGWLRATRMLAMIVLPLTLTIAVCAHELVVVVFGHRWLGAVHVMQILAFVSALQCLQLHDVVLQASGRMKSYLRISAASFALNLAAFVIGLHWGIVGVAAAFAASSTLYFVAYTVLTARVIGMPPLHFLRALSGILLAAASLTIVEVVVSSKLAAWNVDAAATGTIVGLTGVSVFVAACRWRAADVLRDVIEVAGQVRRSRGSGPAVSAA